MGTRDDGSSTTVARPSCARRRTCPAGRHSGGGQAELREAANLSEPRGHGSTGGSGGGGSCRVDPAEGCVVAGDGTIAGNSGDPDHPAGVGNGGAPGGDGNHGLVVLDH